MYVSISGRIAGCWCTFLIIIVEVRPVVQRLSICACLVSRAASASVVMLSRCALKLQRPVKYEVGHEKGHENEERRRRVSISE